MPVFKSVEDNGWKFDVFPIGERRGWGNVKFGDYIWVPPYIVLREKMEIGVKVKKIEEVIKDLNEYVVYEVMPGSKENREWGMVLVMEENKNDYAIIENMDMEGVWEYWLGLPYSKGSFQLVSAKAIDSGDVFLWTYQTMIGFLLGVIATLITRWLINIAGM
jgi:hypothetical protein